MKKGEILFVSKRHLNARRTNINIRTKLHEAEQFLLNNEAKIIGYPIEKLREDIIEVISHQDANIDVTERKLSSITLLDALKKKEKLEGQKPKHWSNRDTYTSSINIFKQFLEYQGIDDVQLIDIDKTWLDEFSTWYGGQSNGKGGIIAKNTIRKRLGQLSYVMKRTCEDRAEKMNWNLYLFQGYKLPKNKAKKRAISMDMLDMDELNEKFDLNEVENIMDLFRQIRPKIGSKKWHARNYLLFMFNCRGMDLVDLSFLTRSHIQNRILEYRRHKVEDDSLLTIDLNEEALEILNTYKYKHKQPNELVFPLMADVYDPAEGLTEEVYHKYRNRVRYVNKHLTDLGGMISLEGKFTTKMIRHTWAQIVLTNTKSYSVVGDGLGHQNDQTARSYSELDRSELTKVNEQTTKRKSKMRSDEYDLTIKLYKNFYKARKADLDANELRNRVVDKVELYTEDLNDLLDPDTMTEWNKRMHTFTSSSFETQEAVRQWIQRHWVDFLDRNQVLLSFTAY